MIYVFLAEGFEEVEALTPVDMLRRCGLEVVTVGVGGKTINGAHNIPVVADIQTSEMKLGNELDMIILPGGMPGTLNLEKSDDVQSAIDYCVKNDRYIAAICAAPSILGHKGLLEGKKACCYPGFEEHLKGANACSEGVCVDGKYVTSRGAGTAMDFALELVKILVSDEKSKALSDSVIYRK